MIIIDKLILEENLDYVLITDVILSSTLEGTDSKQKNPNLSYCGVCIFQSWHK